MQRRTGLFSTFHFIHFMLKIGKIKAVINALPNVDVYEGKRVEHKNQLRKKRGFELREIFHERKEEMSEFEWYEKRPEGIEMRNSKLKGN